MEGDRKETREREETSTSGQRETGRSVERKEGKSQEVEENKIQQLMETIQRVQREKERVVEREVKWIQEQKERHEKEDKRRRETLERDLKRLEGEQERRERMEDEQSRIQEIEQDRKDGEGEYMLAYEQRLSYKDEYLEELRQYLKYEKEKYDRLQEEEKEQREKQERKYRKAKGKLERYEEERERIIEKEVERRKERKEEDEKENKERQETLERDLERLVGEQEKLKRIEYEQRRIQEREESRKAYEKEDRLIYEEGLSYMDEFVEEARQDLKYEKEKYDRLQMKAHPQKNITNVKIYLDEDGQQMKEVNKTEELQNEIIKKQAQGQQAEEFTRKTMVLRKLNKTIKNISTGKTKAPTQVEIIYGERKFGPCKQTNNIQQHLRKIEQVNKEDDEEEIMANIQKIMKRKEGTWTRIQMKCKKVLSKKFWRILENKAHYPLLEGIKNEKCNIKEEHRARIQGNNKRKQIDSNITNNEFCQRNKRWRWSQESDDASERYKRRSLLRIYYQDTLI